MAKNQEKLVDYNSLAKKVFEVKKSGKIIVGGEEIKPELLDVLREQARYLETSQIYELLIATLKNEAVTLPLVSENMEQVQFAKALWHCAFILETMVNGLTVK